MNINDLLDLLAQYWQAGVAALLLAFYLFRQWKKGELGAIVDIVLAWLKEFGQGELQDITKPQVYNAAAIFYTQYIEGTALARFVTLDTFQATVWAAFERLRDTYITAYHQLA